MVSKAKTQRIALKSLVIAVSTLIPLMMTALPGCDFSQAPVEATETPQEVTPTPEQEDQPVIEPGTFSLQEEDGVIRLEGTRTDTGQRLRLVALAPETDLEHTLTDMEARFGAPFDYVTATGLDGQVVDLVGINLRGEDQDQVAQRQAELASSLVAEGPMEILFPTVGSPDANGNSETSLISVDVFEGESLVIDEFGNYWIVKSEALADGGDLAGLIGSLEGRYEALCGNGFHPAVLEVIVRCDLERLKNTQDIEPEMVPQDQEMTVSVKLAKMVEEETSLLQAGELIREEDWGQVEVVFDGELGGLYIRPMSADLIGQVFGGFDKLEEYFKDGIFSDADAETMRRAVQEGLTEEASNRAFRDFYWRAVYNRGKNLDLFDDYETFEGDEDHEGYRQALESAIENGEDLSRFSSFLPDGQEFNPLAPVELRFTDASSFLQARNSVSGRVYEPDYDSDYSGVNRWFLEVVGGEMKFVVDLTSGNRDASYFETGTGGGSITRSIHFAGALARVMATLQHADFPSSGGRLVQVDLMTGFQAKSLMNQLLLQVELGGDRIIPWPFFWVGDDNDAYPPQVP